MSASAEPFSAEEPRPSRILLAWTRADVAVLGLLAVITYAVYAQVLAYAFVYDDQVFILENPRITSWRSIPLFFTQHLAAHAHPDQPGNYYRPFLLVWLLLNRKLWGLNPIGWHFSTLTLHVLVTLSVYFLARRILRNRFAAGFASALFAVHPVHVESVAWVMGFPDPLVTLLGVTSFLCFLVARGAAGRRALWWWAGALFLYALAALTKEPAVVLPGLVAAYELINPDETRRRPWLARIRACLIRVAPYLLLTAVYLAVRGSVLKGFSHTATVLSAGTFLATLPSVVVGYLKLLLWPGELSLFYDLPYVARPGFENFVLPAVAVVIATLGLWLWSTRLREVAVGAVWLVMPLLPVLNLPVLPTGEILHDRYLYLPSVGIVILAATALSKLPSGRWRRLGQPVAQAFVAALIIVLLGCATLYQGKFWSNNVVLYQRALSIAPRNNIATNNYANELVARSQYAEAIRLYRQILSRDPNYWLANYNLGYCHYRLGRLREAEQYLRRAIAIDPADPDQYVYLGSTYLRAGQLEEAESALRQAVARRPDGVGYHFALGLVLKTRGKLQAALEEFQAELAHHPNQSAAQAQIREIDAKLRSSQTGRRR